MDYVSGVTGPKRDPAARKPRGYKADRGGMSYADIEAVATRVRAVLAPNVPLHAAVPGVELFERLESYSVGTGETTMSLTYAVNDLPLGVEAETRFERASGKIVIRLSPETYANLERGKGRARHTLNHEIGHAVLHGFQLRRISVIPHATAALARTSTHQFCEDTEWQADSFAAAIAMPARGLQTLEARYGTLTFRLVSNEMRVSAEAASHRLDTFARRRWELLDVG